MNEEIIMQRPSAKCAEDVQEPTPEELEETAEEALAAVTFPPIAQSAPESGMTAAVSLFNRSK